MARWESEDTEQDTRFNDLGVSISSGNFNSHSDEPDDPWPG